MISADLHPKRLKNIQRFKSHRHITWFSPNYLILHVFRKHLPKSFCFLWKKTQFFSMLVNKTPLMGVVELFTIPSLSDPCLRKFGLGFSSDMTLWIYQDPPVQHQVIQEENNERHAYFFKASSEKILSKVIHLKPHSQALSLSILESFGLYIQHMCTFNSWENFQSKQIYCSRRTPYYFSCRGGGGSWAKHKSTWHSVHKGYNTCY